MSKLFYELGPTVQLCPSDFVPRYQGSFAQDLRGILRMLGAIPQRGAPTVRQLCGGRDY